jgi:HEAT repeat protein
MARVGELKQQLSSLDSQRRRQALFAVVQGDVKELSSYVLSIFRRETDSTVRGLSAWALGKLMHKGAYTDLVKALQTADPEVRRWSAWALGEIGLYEAFIPLGRALNSERNPTVRRAIGGALKKLRLEPTRVHLRAVTKRLQPPPTDDRRVEAIVQELGSLEWPLDKDAIIDLRRQMQQIAPLYFRNYMDWLRRKPSIESALVNKSKVYTDLE